MEALERDDLSCPGASLKEANLEMKKKLTDAFSALRKAGAFPAVSPSPLILRSPQADQQAINLTLRSVLKMLDNCSPCTGVLTCSMKSNGGFDFRVLSISNPYSRTGKGCLG